MKYLLDVNVLIALVDSKHYGHDAVSVWFQQARRSWATCPIVQNGFIRILSGATYKPPVGPPEQVAAVLEDLINQPGHEFFGESVSLFDTSLFNLSALTSHHQVTDTYLLGLALRHGAQLATLDRKLSTRAVLGGEKALKIIGPLPS